MIDRNSDTWLTIEQWLNDRRGECINALINGTANDEKRRGEIRLIDDLKTHAEINEKSKPVPFPGPDY